MEVRIINHSQNELPAYATSGSAGVDLRANIASPLTLRPLQRELIPTGLYLEIPGGYEGQVRPRSGLAVNKGITCLNSPGTIDSDYRGEIKVLLINLGQEDQVINSGERIAQIIFAPVQQVQFIETNELSETVRSSGGFGHTGTV